MVSMLGIARMVGGRLKASYLGAWTLRVSKELVCGFFMAYMGACRDVHPIPPAGPGGVAFRA